MSEFDPVEAGRRAWNAGRKVGAKRALKPRQVWAICIFLDQHRRMLDRAPFDLAIDSKLRGCDVVTIRIGDLVPGGQVRSRATVCRRSEDGQAGAVRPDAGFACQSAGMAGSAGRHNGRLRVPESHRPYPPLSTRQYARLVDEWVVGVGLRRVSGDRPSWRIIRRPGRQPPARTATLPLPRRC